MKLLATNRSEQNQAAIDPWTVVHLGAGLAFGLTGISLPTTVIAGVGYEVAEQIFERSDTGQSLFNTSGPENAVNVAVDLAVYFVGWYAGRRWSS